MIRSASDAGSLYGSVTPRDAAEVATEAGFSVDRKQVALIAPIKELGLHNVAVRLHPEVTVEITLNVARSEEEAELMTHSHERINIFDFGGPLSFGAAADVGHQVREKSGKLSQVTMLDFSQVPFIDVSAVRAVETIANDGKMANKLVYISGMNDAVKDVLEGLMGEVIPKDHFFSIRRDAIAAAVEFVESTEGKPEQVSGEPALA